MNIFKKIKKNWEEALDKALEKAREKRNKAFKEELEKEREILKKTPEYNDAAWLLQYQIESMLDIYKRLM